MPLLEDHLTTLKSMKQYPKQLFYSGDLGLLQRKKVSIVGTRKPSKYSRENIRTLSRLLANNGVSIVSGGAMGIDAIAHSGAGVGNTIAVLPCGIDIKYPVVNKNLLADIEKNGLLLSQFENSQKARPYSFVVRNELVVALGDILIVGEAEIDSGSMRSVEFALAMGKKIYVLPHRLGESAGTNELIATGKAKAIYDIDKFVQEYCGISQNEVESDPFKILCQSNPSYEELVKQFPERVFEAELNGEIAVKNAKVFLL